jgi:hypothetical protein
MGSGERRAWKGRRHLSSIPRNSRWCTHLRGRCIVSSRFAAWSGCSQLWDMFRKATRALYFSSVLSSEGSNDHSVEKSTTCQKPGFPNHRRDTCTAAVRAGGITVHNPVSPRLTQAGDIGRLKFATEEDALKVAARAPPRFTCQMSPFPAEVSSRYKATRLN